MSDCGNVQKLFVPSEKKKLKRTMTGVDISDKAAEKLVFVQSEKRPC